MEIPIKQSEKVKGYYENNTRRFLWFQRDASTKSIHQPLWQKPNSSTKEAFNYSNQLVLEEIVNHKKDKSLTIIDLGCGVGSSIFYLLKELKITVIYYGVTISSTQIKIAQQHLQKINAQKILPVHFIEADFTALPLTIPSIDIAYSIEAFVHAPSATAYFEQISKKLKLGGKLLLIDDFLNDAIVNQGLDKKGKRAVADFQYGWLANSLLTKKELSRIGQEYGLEIISETDLTPLMHNNTFKHKWIRFLVISLRWLYELSPWKSYYFRSWIGGKGKQYCLKKGIVKYKKIVFQKIV